MTTNPSDINQSAVLGQKYAFATASLLLGIVSFIALLGMEKAILAIIFGWLALRSSPPPSLNLHRHWGKVGIGLGTVHILLLVGLLLAGGNILVAALGLVTDYVEAIRHGPKIVQSMPSPDGNFVAYVEDAPSIDPPNQSCFVERKDQRHFMCIACLAEDVDAIEKIYWSPDSRIAVFHSQCYLTAVRLEDWQTIRIYLGREWVRSQPHRQATFNSRGVRLEVTAVEFREPESFSYRLKGSNETITTRFGLKTPAGQ